MLLQPDYQCHLTQSDDVAISERVFLTEVYLNSSEEALQYKQIDQTEYERLKRQQDALAFEPTAEYYQQLDAVLKDLGSVMGDIMASGRSVKLEGLGSFYYTANTAKQGVATPEEVSAKQITGARVRFIPETTRNSNNQVVTRSMVSTNLFWEEWGGSTTPSGGNEGGGTDEDQTENPLG